MSEQNTNQDTNQEQAATMAQLKKEFPKASAEFLVEQLEGEVTLTEAHRAYSAHLVTENERLEAERAEAEAKAQKLEEENTQGSTNGAPAAGKKRGNTPTVKSETDEIEPVDYVEMAKQLAQEKEIGFRAAVYEIKKRFPEAREAFLGPVLQG